MSRSLHPHMFLGLFSVCLTAIFLLIYLIVLLLYVRNPFVCCLMRDIMGLDMDWKGSREKMGKVEGGKITQNTWHEKNLFLIINNTLLCQAYFGPNVKFIISIFMIFSMWGHETFRDNL